MALHLDLADPVDAARIVDALLLAAEVETLRKPMLAKRYTRIADDIGDALDRAPKPASCLLTA